MSELQAALLGIGAGVVLLVYLFGWWKQRQYRQRFAEAFGENRKDALYGIDGAPIDPSVEMINVDALDALDAGLEEAVELPAAPEPIEPCVLLDARFDFIIELHLTEPATSAVLDGLWQRKFDFHKPLHVCGLSVRTETW